jgi:uncharacterized protein YoxC
LSTYETVIVIGVGLWIVIALALLVCVIYAISILRRTREPIGHVADSVRELQTRLQPVLRNVERASEDANYLVSTLRTDADEVGRAMRRVSDSTGRMLDLVEERVAEVTALLAVVQEEAEETFLTSASLLRGLRGRRKEPGTRRLRRAIAGLGRNAETGS